MGGYSYPDPTDDITAAMISGVVDGTDYWQLSEQQALTVADRALSRWVGDHRVRVAVDVGTGLGRLLPWLATRAERVVATDPDGRRLAVAVQAAEHLENVEFSELDAVNSSVADLILCSHVLQHVPIATQDALLVNVSRVATDRAALVLSYTHATAGERYVIERINGAQHHAEEVDETTFNEYATRPWTTSGEIFLPVRYVDSSDVERALKRCGWYELLRWEHHIDVVDIEPTISDDLIVNARVHDIPFRGRDVMSVFRKAP